MQNFMELDIVPRGTEGDFLLVNLSTFGVEVLETGSYGSLNIAPARKYDDCRVVIDPLSAVLCSVLQKTVSMKKQEILVIPRFL